MGIEAIIWFIAALVLAAGELAVGEFTLLMLSGGALAASGATLLGAPVWAATAVFAVVAVGLIAFLRPVLQRKMATPPALDTSTSALVGSHAEVLEPVTRNAGQVRLDGSVWSARSMDPQARCDIGDEVTVVRIDGPVAIVWKES